MHFFCAVVACYVLAGSSFVLSQGTPSQILSSLPSCASTCVKSFTASVGCSPMDSTCQCSNKEQIVGGIGVANTASACVVNACGFPKANTTWNMFSGMCDMLKSGAAPSSLPPTSSSLSEIDTATSTSPLGQISTPPTSTTIRSSTKSTASGTSPTSTSVATTGPFPTPDTDNNGQLTSGARAGIAIAISIASLLLFLAVLYIHRRSRRLRRYHDQNPEAGFMKPESRTRDVAGQQSVGARGAGTQRQMSMSSTLLADKPENRPKVPKKDEESEKELRAVIHQLNLSVQTEQLPDIRESPGNVQVKSEVENGTQIHLHPSGDVSEPRVLTLNPFADDNEAPPSPQESIRTIDMPSTPQSFETTPTRSAFTSYRQSRASERRPSTESTATTHHRISQNPMPTFRLSEVSTVERETRTSTSPERLQIKVPGEDLVPTAKFASPLTQNPFSPADKNFEPANKYFTQQNSSK